MIPRVVLVRHGSTALNSGAAVEKIRGWADIPLNEEGKEEAKDRAFSLRTCDFAKIYSSDLQRALYTAEAIAKEHAGMEVTKTAMLRPWNVGNWTGQPVAAVVEDMIRYTHEENRAPPGGEPFSTFRLRALSFLETLTREAYRRRLVFCAVTHTRVTQLARAWVARGAKRLAVDLHVMNDYTHETGTGEDISLRPRANGVILEDEYDA